MGAAVFGFAVFAFVGSLVVWSVKHSRKVEQERTNAMRATAERLGWTYREEVPFKAVPDLDRFELFRHGGSSRKLRHVLTSPEGDVRAVLFDFRYTVSTGKSTTTVQQTVLYLTSEAFDLPIFSLRPENFLHNIAAAFGFQDIDVESRPQFSEKFLLRGADEARVRAAFSDQVCEFFEPREGMCASGEKHELLYWRPGKLAKPEQIDTLIADGDELSARFAESTQPS